jgi:hypothetical protein
MACILFGHALSRGIWVSTFRDSFVNAWAFVRLDPNAIGGDRSTAISMMSQWTGIGILWTIIGIVCGYCLSVRYSFQLWKPNYWSELQVADRTSIYRRSLIQAHGVSALMIVAILVGHMALHTAAQSHFGFEGTTRRLYETHPREALSIGGLVDRLANSAWANEAGYFYAIPPLPWLLVCWTCPGLAFIFMFGASYRHRCRSLAARLESRCICGYAVQNFSRCPECGLSVSKSTTVQLCLPFCTID